MKNIFLAIAVALVGVSAVFYIIAHRQTASSAIGEYANSNKAQVDALLNQVDQLQNQLTNAKPDIDNLPKDANDNSTTTATSTDDANKAEASYARDLLNALQSTLSQMSQKTSS